MKSLKSLWLSIPVIGRIFLAVFVFYFSSKTFGKN